MWLRLCRRNSTMQQRRNMTWRVGTPLRRSTESLFPVLTALTTNLGVSRFAQLCSALKLLFLVYSDVSGERKMSSVLSCWMPDPIWEQERRREGEEIRTHAQFDVVCHDESHLCDTGELPDARRRCCSRRPPTVSQIAKQLHCKFLVTSLRYGRQSP